MDNHERWQLSRHAAERYEAIRVPAVHAPVAAVMLERIGLRTGERLLDVACGTGIAARLAAPLVGPGGRVVGLDRSEDMLSVARQCAAEAGFAIEWRRGDAAALPFGEAEFDAVLCQQGLQFFPDPVAALLEMRRVAAAGAAVAVSVGTPSAYNLALAEALSRYADAATAARSLAPYALGEKSLLAQHLDAAGFGEASIETVALSRRIEPTQRWLLDESDATPYGAAISALAPETRAALLRDIAAALKAYWNGESFSVPREVHVAVSRKT